MNKKNLVILGATCKLGIELSYIYANNNYNLILISRRLTKLSDLKSSLKRKFPNTNIEVHELDILDLENQKLIFNKIKKISTGIISLIGETHYVERINDKKLFNIININFTYLIHFLSLFLEEFEKKNEGFLICVSSVAGLRGRAKNFFYGSAKAALITFLSGCKNYFYNSNIFIMTVLPGFIKNNNDKKKIIENILQVEPSILAKKIFLAHTKKKQILYSSFIWKMIMKLIQIMPNSIFNKMKF
tara:strand:+ start:413 stop:1147 length:735 start_codon:yes stop_codon:yes gene_type:complete